MSNTALKERGETALQSPAIAEERDGQGKVIRKAVKAGATWSAGEGVVLRFRNSDLKAIEADVGPGFFNRLADEFSIGTMSFATLEVYLKHGVKKGGEPYTIPDDVLDNIPISALWDAIFDGVCRSMRGESAEEYVGRLMKLLQEEPDEPLDPPNARENTSTSSDEQPSGQE